MDEIFVRPAEMQDLETLLVFEQGVIETERPFDPTLKNGPVNYYDLEKMISAPDIHLVVAIAGDRLVGSGYCRIEPDKPYLKHTLRGYLGFMYTLPSCRGKGINKMIIDELKKWAKSKQLTELRLDVYAQNERASRAYNKSGFVPHMVQMRMGLDPE